MSSVLVLGGNTKFRERNMDMFEIQNNGNDVTNILTLPEELWRHNPARCDTGEFGLFCGGGSSTLTSGSMTQCTLYDVNKRSPNLPPTLLQPLLQKRYKASATCNDGQLYVIGGSNSNARTKVVTIRKASR